MTREEQIIQASDEWTYQKPPQYSELVHKTHKVMCAYQVGFIDGAVWADSHPHWISVEDELPPLEIVSERWETSDDVLVYTLSCGIFVSRYEFDKRTHEHYWVFSDHDYIVTHWMPLPQPPKKGGEK